MTIGVEAARVLSDDELRRVGLSAIKDIPDAFIYADRSETIRFWNAGSTRIFGYAADDAVGRSLDIIIPERLRGRHWVGFDEMMETEEPHHPPDGLRAVPALTRSGKAISIEFTVAPVRDGQGMVESMAAILRDVVERFEELKRLRKAAR
ncbi:MAG: PAS domain S-box protein [Gammaproteobacteria bacterium]